MDLISDQINCRCIRTKDKFDGPMFEEDWLIYGGNYIREEKHFNLQSVKLITFLFFFFFSDLVITSSHKW